jgi:hypothetical protein
LVFEDVNYSFHGKGRWLFAIDSQNILSNGAYVDPLKYDGFVAYSATGVGASPEDAKYSFSTNSNGLNFNVSASLDSSVYTDNNLSSFGSYLQAAWEVDVLRLMMYNPNNRINADQRNEVLNKQMLALETTSLKDDTAARRLDLEYRKAVKKLELTYDRAINDNDDYEIQISSM